MPNPASTAARASGAGEPVPAARAAQSTARAPSMPAAAPTRQACAQRVALRTRRPITGAAASVRPVTTTLGML